MGSHETERKTTAWAARDPSGILSPYTYSLRNTGPEDVFIKVICCGICHTDIHLAKNDLGKSNYPMVPGHEVVGEVVEVGSGVTKFSAGEIVGVGCLVGCCRNCRPCNTDSEQYCAKKIWSYNDVYTDGNPTQGGFAGSMVVDQKFVVKIPDGMAPEGGILGLGGVGHMGVKIAKAMGHHVTVISSSDKKKLEALEYLGADEYLVSTDAEGMQKAAKSLDYIIDTVPVFHPLEPYLSLLRHDGKLILMGVINTPLQFLTPVVILGRKEITGSFIGSMKETEELLAFCKEKDLRSTIEVVKMDYINTAMARVAKNDVRYRIQKSRIKWAISGDRNTKFFHLMASVRKNINVISTLKIGNDSFCAPAQIKQAVRDHFKSSYNSSMTLPVKQFNCELPKLKESSSFRLERQFTEEEVWSVLSKMEASKAPGPDGFNMGFLKKFWGYLKSDIMAFLDNFSLGNLEDFTFNHSFIVLIPKNRSPVSLDDYRPISLVGCIYKLLAKVLAIRLGEVSEEIIGENQFAFCQGKQILDCSLIANELIDFSRRNRLEGVIFKADFRKAYDSVDWGFLMFVMEKMGFGPTWLKWIYCCLSTASISVLINGSPSNAFSIGRGLRQGCPLSPMLFNLVAEALSVFIRSANKMSLFNGVRLGPSVPEITHLQFADDLIIFCGASETQIKNVVRLLKGFEIASGLKLNLLKSKLIGVNVENNVIDSWANLLHCKRENLPCSYLGLPLGATKNSVHLWAPIVERFKQKLAGWKSRCLSFAGKLALVKSVLASVPIYFISIFAIPATIKSLLSKLIARFLWGSLDKKAVHWVSWETMCLPKSRGGLGLVDFGIKNRALLNKWLWKYGTEPNSLWRRIIAAKYEGESSSLLPVNLNPANKSWIWRNLLKPLSNSEDLFTQNIRLLVGNGRLVIVSLQRKFDVTLFLE
ncbi:hypothetical protein GQ457_03G003350 [Hibiscus cannabinus]